MLYLFRGVKLPSMLTLMLITTSLSLLVSACHSDSSSSTTSIRCFIPQMSRLYKVAVASFLIGVIISCVILSGLWSTLLIEKQTIVNLRPGHSVDTEHSANQVADNYNVNNNIIHSNTTPADKVLPPEWTLLKMSRKGVSQIYHDYVGTIQIHCGRVIRLGRSGDGGWDVCIDPPFTLTPPCLVFSFGINYDFSFDDDVAYNFNCVVHAYDPSMDRAEDHMRGNWVHFHKIGLDDKHYVDPSGWKMQTFSTILKETGYPNTTIDVLKIDIECAELRALPEMLKAGSLKKVKQLCFEMHIKRAFQPEPDIQKYIFGLSIFRDLYNEGFRIFNSHKNMYPKYTSMFGMERTGCHEVYMIRVH